MQRVDARPMLQHGFVLFWLGLVAWALLGGGGGCSTPAPDPHEAAGFQNFTSPQSNPIVLSPDRAWVYVANTTSNSVTFIRTATFSINQTVPTGIEPVSLAVRPDGLELWVSNHVSDTVSVIDTDPTSASYAQVIETIQQLDTNGVTQLDEPVGIAFASNSKAYVALSSRNRIAVIDATTYQPTSFIQLTAQEPRAITVRNGKLYVAAFESGNKSQLSACAFIGGANCTLGIQELIDFATNPNLPGEVKNIVSGAGGFPDRDIFVYDTSNEAPLSTATNVGTLLYGLTVAANGTIYVSETDARNLVNGVHGSTLAGLDGRMFDNEIARVTCPTASCTTAITNLEGGATTHANSLATPYGIALSADDSTLLVSAAGASRLASYRTSDMAQQHVLSVGSIPKGVAFDSASGAGGTAYVLNTLGNSVTKISVDPTTRQLSLVATRTVGSDPTPAAVRSGNIAFNSAFASTTGNHSCGSCHPDGNTDQLLWRIGGSCEDIGCDPGDEPRSTQPIRGLKNTLPLHWDGTLGDPFGGGNGSVGLGGVADPSHACDPNDADGDHDCFLDLVEGALSGVMCLQSGACPNTGLDAQAQDEMATFLASVAYPPARSRRVDDQLSSFGDATPATLNGTTVSAQQGFMDFFVDQGGAAQPHTCADADGGCHALPLLTATNSATLAGFDSPTMRGLTDRFLQFSMGTTNTTQLLVFASNPPGGSGITPIEPEIAYSNLAGFQEVTTFATAFIVFEPTYNVRPLNLFQMFEEASTGYSGALGRQVTLNSTTAGQASVQAVLSSLQAADTRGVVNLRGAGLRSGAKVNLSWDAPNNHYLVGTSNVTLTQAQLIAEAVSGTTLATLTAHLRSGTATSPQPLLSSTGSPSSGLIGDPPLPNPSTASNPPAFTLTSLDVSTTAVVFVNGQLSSGATVACGAGSAGGFCNDGLVTVDLATSPGAGLHLLQVQNPSGLLSNEMPVCFGASSGCVSD